jgi:peptidoglycan hydrolase CwlO-like protein
VNWETIIAALIVGVLGGGGAVALFRVRSENRVKDAEAWDKLIKALTTRVEELEKRLDERDERIDELELELDELRDWIKEQGLKPPPRRRSRRA